MTERRMLIIDRGLIEKMDESRGDLDRAEFIELCLNTCFRDTELKPKMPPGRARPATHFVWEEFEKHRGSSKDSIAIDPEFMEMIDENRGSLTRAEFVGLCVKKTSFQEAEPRAETPPTKAREDTYASGVEFQEFKSSIRDFLRALVHFVSFGLNRGKERLTRRMEDTRQHPDKALDSEESKPPRGFSSATRSGIERYYPDERDDHQRVPRERESLEDLKQRLHEIQSEEAEPQRGRRRFSNERYDVEEEEAPRQSYQRTAREAHYPGKCEESAEGAGQSMYFSLWIPAILLFGFGDTLLSTMVFAKGGHEINPLMILAVRMFGGNLFAFVMIKTAVLVILALISFKMFKKQGWLIPGILCFVGTFLVFSNLVAYLKLA